MSTAHDCQTNWYDGKRGMLKRRTIFSPRGGVHPRYHKESTATQPIETTVLPEKLYVSMSQHLGAPAKPVVKKGDSVLRGQLLGEPAGFVSASVHAPFSGKITAISDRPALSGQSVAVIEIESDGEDRWDTTLKPCHNWQALDSKALIEIISSAGIVGMGGAGFPTHIKLSPPPGKQIDTLIINGAECEPYLTSDHRLMLEHPDRVWAGAKIIRKILGVDKVRVVIEDNKPDAIHTMERVLGDSEKNSRSSSSDVRFVGRDQSESETQVAILKTRYPQGAEKQLIYAITGREVPSGGLPMDVGVLVQNVGTCAAIYEAVEEGHPLTERIVTVTGELIKTPKNLRARIGTTFSALTEFCGGISPAGKGQSGEIGKLICGGPMMGLAQSSLETAVTKTTSGIMLMPRTRVLQFSSAPCMSCSRCVRTCPMGLMPCTLSEMIEAEEYDGAESENVLDCIECGCCAYECPAYRPLVQHMKQGKAEVTRRRKERELKAKWKRINRCG